uniref:Disease resistance R13L4/SHOC-2-like LRR domain-containing protein n=1 Tax=Manihot esculenta TaxID=3983 RepID=A0A2C9VQ47_MANES
MSAWGITADCCSWVRVDCNSTTGHVVQLSLYDVKSTEGDYWYLNASLFLPFQQLNSLTLWGNNIAGCIKNEGFERLSALGNLEHLDLGGNSFHKSILSSLSGLSSLKILSLYGNRLKGIINIEEFNHLRSLKELSLSENAIEGFISSNELGKSKLVTLNLSGNNITKFVDSREIRASNNISELYLNHITITKGSKLLESLGAFSHLKSLFLESCKFEGAMLNQGLPHLQKIGAMSSLKKLSLRNCGLNDSEFLNQGVCKLKQLQELDISYNDISGGLPSCLANMTSFQSLDLSSNNFVGNISLYPFKRLTNLEYLDFSYNLFQIPISLDPFFNHSKLKHFKSRDNNEIYGEKTEQNLTPMFQLETLSIDGYACNETFPKFLYYQHNLRVASLQSLKLRGRFPYWLLENNTKLEKLYLKNNSLSGPLQLPLHSHLNLSFLDISDNLFHGIIPLDIGTHLSRLELVDLSKNDFNGSIPSSFRNMSLLQILDLSNNDISGSLPSDFSCSNMIGVYLSRNQLQGSLEDAFFDCLQLVVLDLSHNNMTGSIPSWFERFYQLGYMILGHNNIEGEIPIQLCNLTQLSLIDLSHNNLSGHIPPCLRSTSNFASLSLSSGEEIEFTTKRNIYSYQTSMLDYFSGIDLSCNKLIGQIPIQIGYLNEIHVLNLSHNNLNGKIPASFSNLSQIESLDLSHNNLQGNIHSQLTELDFLEVFNVSCNDLSGKTPEKVKQFATFDESSYRDNPLLCGWPLQKDCATMESSPSISRNSNDTEESNCFIDMEGFYVSFGVAYVMVLLTIAGVLFINPYWRQVWFYFVEVSIDKCYYFLIDNLGCLSKFKLF